MAEQDYENAELYGGAITADLPADFLDISTLRQVPDHQEVRLSRDGLSSIMFDILERVAPPNHDVTTDEAALHYHYADVVAAGFTRNDVSGASPSEETRIWSASRVVLPHLGNNIAAWNMCATQHPSTEEEGRPLPDGTPDFTTIMLTLIRLEAQNTDLLVSINVPHIRGEYDPASVDMEAGTMGPLTEAAMEWQAQIYKSFRIEDWDLFVDE